MACGFNIFIRSGILKAFLCACLSACGGSGSRIFVNRQHVTGSQSMASAKIDARGQEDESLVAGPSSSRLEKTSFRLLGENVRGPSSVLLDAAALEAVFRPTFGNSPRFGNKSTFLLANPGAYFTPSERAALGTFDSEFGARDAFRMKWSTQVTQEYVHVLRMFLSDACANLVEEEMKAPADPVNKLVLGDIPSEKRIDSFMTRVFGNAAPDGLLHVGAAQYGAVFLDAVGPLPALSQQRRDRSAANYKLLCLSIGSDVRVFMR